MFKTFDDIENDLAAEEAIQLLKIEVMAQDWSLSSRRGTAIGEALKTLHPHFNGRKGALYIFEMIKGVLDHIALHGGKTQPEAIDFLKAALANIVILYEEGALQPKKEAEFFHRTYENFKKLKAQVARNKKII